MSQQCVAEAVAAMKAGRVDSNHGESDALQALSSDSLFVRLNMNDGRIVSIESTNNLTNK